MKSFCIKTNNTNILDYLLERIKAIDFENLVYSQNEFKVYQNVIVHYRGDQDTKFAEFLSNLIEEIVFKFYEEKIIKQLLNYNYFYFDEFEKTKILDNCKQMIEEEKKTKMQDKKIIKKEIVQYILEHNSMVLDGFIYFRLQKYFSYLDKIVDGSVNQFVIEKEYTEFISLLRIYVESRMPEYELLHLIYYNGESILLDDDKNVVSVSDNIYNAKYLSDISFSSNDFALNTLLTLLPAKIEIHLIDEEDEFINTIKLIFEDKVSICKECNICKTYRLLKSVKATK